MDLLDEYKKAWENQPEAKYKISREEIFKMMHAKSASIVKWIFYIGLIEFLILILSFCFIDYDDVLNKYNRIGIKQIMIYYQFIFLIPFFYFLYLFYKNYTRIKVTDNTNQLMIKILKTRKTVKNYVIYCLGTTTLGIIITLIAIILKTSNSHGFSQKTGLMILGGIIGLILCIGLSWLFYQLLYGILLKKLNENYKDLAKLEELN